MVKKRPPGRPPNNAVFDVDSGRYVRRLQSGNSTDDADTTSTLGLSENPSKRVKRTPKRSTMSEEERIKKDEMDRADQKYEQHLLQGKEAKEKRDTLKAQLTELKKARDTDAENLEEAKNHLEEAKEKLEEANEKANVSKEAHVDCLQKFRKADASFLQFELSKSFQFEQDTCSICQDEMQPSSKYNMKVHTILPCQHQFHAACFSQYCQHTVNRSSPDSYTGVSYTDNRIKCPNCKTFFIPNANKTAWTVSKNQSN